jgi:hypothetical protein
MRKQMAVIALLVLAACGQQSEQKADQAPAAQATENVIRSRNASHWVVREGQFANDAFTLQASGMAFVQNSQAAVAAGDEYTGEIVIAAGGPGTVVVRVSNGCGTPQSDQGLVEYNVQPGENTLRVQHTFARAAECARLSLTSQTLLTYRLTSASLTRTHQAS